MNTGRSAGYGNVKLYRSTGGGSVESHVSQHLGGGAGAKRIPDPVRRGAGVKDVLEPLGVHDGGKVGEDLNARRVPQNCVL